jgi:nucleotide-binding universal stress UspA family protein
MNGRTDRVPRLIVGISRSRASWWALAWAVGEARRRPARLLLVHVFHPPVAPSLGETNPGFVGTARDPYAEHVAYGNTLIQAAISQAVGRMPVDVSVEQRVISGRAAAELAGLAFGGDILVLGGRHRGWLRRFAPGSVARACARRAACPVMIVPEPSPRELPALLPMDSAHGHRFRWMPHRGAQTASS